jgi:hypothetical protein
VQRNEISKGNKREMRVMMLVKMGGQRKRA